MLFRLRFEPMVRSAWWMGCDIEELEDAEEFSESDPWGYAAHHLRAIVGAQRRHQGVP